MVRLSNFPKVTQAARKRGWELNLGFGSRGLTVNHSATSPTRPTARDYGGSWERHRLGTTTERILLGVKPCAQS